MRANTDALKSLINCMKEENVTFPDVRTSEGVCAEAAHQNREAEGCGRGQLP